MWLSNALLLYLVLKEFDFGGAVDVQSFLPEDSLLLDEVTECLLDLVLPEVVLHPSGVLRAVGDLPKEATPGQVEQDKGPAHVDAATNKLLQTLRTGFWLLAFNYYFKGLALQA